MGKIILSRENGIPFYCYLIITNSSLNKRSWLFLVRYTKIHLAKKQNPTLHCQTLLVNTGDLTPRQGYWDSLQHTGETAAGVESLRVLGGDFPPHQGWNSGTANTFLLLCVHRRYQDWFWMCELSRYEDLGTSSANLSQHFLKAGTNSDCCSSE